MSRFLLQTVGAQSLALKAIEIDHDLPLEAEVREWLEFIELQCEECFPSEWPQ